MEGLIIMEGVLGIERGNSGNSFTSEVRSGTLVKVPSRLLILIG